VLCHPGPGVDLEENNLMNSDYYQKTLPFLDNRSCVVEGQYQLFVVASGLVSSLSQHNFGRKMRLWQAANQSVIQPEGALPLPATPEKHAGSPQGVSRNRLQGRDALSVKKGGPKPPPETSLCYRAAV
jgi:hypothetical protein